MELTCLRCGTLIEIRPGPTADDAARECLVCPVCWATGPAHDDADSLARFGEDDGYRLLGVARPDGPEFASADSERRALARMLWELAADAAQLP